MRQVATFLVTLYPYDCYWRINWHTMVAGLKAFNRL